MSNNLVEVIFQNELTDAGLSDLRAKYPADVVTDMSVEENFKQARKTRTEMNKLVDAINRRRIDVSSEIKTHGDNLIKQVTDIYSVVVQPFEIEDQRRKDIAAEEKRKYDEKISAERAQIKEISDWVTFCSGKSPAEIQDIIEAVDLIDTAGFHKDLIHEAIEVKDSTLNSLSGMLQQAITNEQADKQRQAAETELRIEQRISALKMLPLDYMIKPLSDVESKLQSLANYQPDPVEFGERYNEAITAQQAVIQQMEMIASQKRQQEAAAAQQAVKQPEPEQPETEQVKTAPASLQEAKQDLSEKLNYVFSITDNLLKQAISEYCTAWEIPSDGEGELIEILNSFGIDV